MSSGERPYMVRHRAAASAQTSMSPFVLGMQMGFPVVPDEQWKRTISRMGAAVSPRGYSSRRSVLTMKGSFAMSARLAMSRGFTPFSSHRWRKRRTRSYS